MSKQIDLKALLESRMENIEPTESSKKAIERVEMNVPHKILCLMQKVPNLSQKQSL